jgi:hypothetical protein
MLTLNIFKEFLIICPNSTWLRGRTFTTERVLYHQCLVKTSQVSLCAFGGVFKNKFNVRSFFRHLNANKNHACISNITMGDCVFVARGHIPDWHNNTIHFNRVPSRTHETNSIVGLVHFGHICVEEIDLTIPGIDRNVAGILEREKG